MIKFRILVLPLFLLLASCEEQPLQAVGQLESDRIELVAEFSEVITSINVTEGDGIQAGAIVLEQDTTRIDLRIEESQANIRRIEAVLAEQVSGPRTETIDAAKANLNAARLTNPNVKCIGIAINTKAFSEEEAEAFLKKTEAEMGLPTVDPVRSGVGRLVDALL